MITEPGEQHPPPNTPRGGGEAKHINQGGELRNRSMATPHTGIRTEHALWEGCNAQRARWVQTGTGQCRGSRRTEGRCLMSGELECSMGTKRGTEGKGGSQQLEWEKLVVLDSFYSGMLS